MYIWLLTLSHMIQNFGCRRSEKRVMYEKRNILDPDRIQWCTNSMRIVCTQIHATNVLKFPFSFYDRARCEGYDREGATVMPAIRCARCTWSLNTPLLRRLSPANLRVELDVAPCFGYNAPWSKKYNVRIVVNR